MNYYVYRITNTVLNKHYYGYRSCKIDPKEDLGKKYFSSSRDKEFIKDQKQNPLNYKYKIIKLFSTKKEAIIFESKLHTKFDVKNNSFFYNKANQSLNGFSTSDGYFHVKDLGWISKEEYYKQGKKIHSFGMVPVLDTRDNKTKRVTTREYMDNSYYESVSKNKIACLCIDTKLILQISKDEFYENPNKYQSLNKGMVASFNIKTKESKLVSVEEYHSNPDLKHPSSGLVSVFDTETQTTKAITKKEYELNKDRYQGVNKGRISGNSNPNKKLIHIYDNNGIIRYECDGNFEQICKEENLPFGVLKNSYMNNGIKLYLKREPSYKEFLKFKGWFAKIKE